MVLADGTLTQCSRSENPELFGLAMGGYGLFGIIVELDVDMTPNQLLEPRFERMSPERFADQFVHTIDTDRAVTMAYGRMSVSRKKFFDDAVKRLKEIDPSGPLPDRYVQSNFEAMNALKLGIEKSGFQGRADTPKLLAALEGLEMKEGDDLPQGDKTLRKEDHQAFLRQFIFEMKGTDFKILQVVDKDKTIVPAACHFAAT